MKKHFYLLVLALTILLQPAYARENFDNTVYKRLAQQCQQNDLDSCVQLAIWTRDFMESPAAAVAPLEKACKGGNMKGCNILGGLYLNKYSGLGLDYRKAQALFDRSCKGGYDNACQNLKNLKEQMKTSHTQPSKEKRLQSLQKSCMLENTAACEALLLETTK